MLMKHVSETPPPLHGFRPDAPRVLVEILDRCLAKKPQDRWDSALLLRDTLRRIQRDGSLETPPPPPAPMPYANAAERVVDRERALDRLDDKFGHRSEDWAPRRVVEPAPAPRQLPAPGALPPIPQIPPLPEGADRGARREWKKAQKEAVKLWRQSVKAQRKEQSIAYTADLRARTNAMSMAAYVPFATPASIADRVMRFRKSVKVLAASSAVGIGSLIIGVSINEEVFIAPMLGGLVVGLGSLSVAARHALKLRRLGIGPLEAWGDRWRAIAARFDTRTADDRRRELVEKVGGGLSTGSRYHDIVRNAADDRLVIQEITVRLTPDDRALVPDVEPTADALLERIGAIAGGLERLDRDLPGGALADLAQRIAAVEAEPETSPDRERRLSLLTRQRASLDDLNARRDTLQRQLDSASMALRSLRFDIVKLRTLGVDAAGDLTSATQEARAVSRELGYVIDAAEESRRL